MYATLRSRAPARTRRRCRRRPRGPRPAGGPGSIAAAWSRGLRRCAPGRDRRVLRRHGGRAGSGRVQGWQGSWERFFSWSRGRSRRRARVRPANGTWSATGAILCVGVVASVVARVVSDRLRVASVATRDVSSLRVVSSVVAHFTSSVAGVTLIHPRTTSVVTVVRASASGRHTGLSRGHVSVSGRHASVCGGHTSPSRVDVSPSGRGASGSRRGASRAEGPANHAGGPASRAGRRASRARGPASGTEARDSGLPRLGTGSCDCVACRCDLPPDGGYLAMDRICVGDEKYTRLSWSSAATPTTASPFASAFGVVPPPVVAPIGTS